MSDQTEQSTQSPYPPHGSLGWMETGEPDIPEDAIMPEKFPLAVGDRVLFEPYKRRMTVRAVTRGGRFAILTMPFAAKGTVIYTVIDFERGVRGCDDHYGVGYETDEQIAEAIEGFQATEDGLSERLMGEALARGENSIPSPWQIEVSGRKFVPLDFRSINDTLVSRDGRRLRPEATCTCGSDDERFPDTHATRCLQYLALRTKEQS